MRHVAPKHYEMESFIQKLSLRAVRRTAKKLPLRGSWQGAALTDEGRYAEPVRRNLGRIRRSVQIGLYEFARAFRSRKSVPPSSLNYGIAATGSYFNLRFAARSTTLRRSPFPGGEGWGFPVRGYVQPRALSRSFSGGCWQPPLRFMEWLLLAEALAVGAFGLGGV